MMPVRSGIDPPNQRITFSLCRCGPLFGAELRSIGDLGDGGRLEKNIIVAWDGSRPLRKALVAALLFLAKALKVHVVIFSPATPRVDSAAKKNGRDSWLFLVRDGPNVDVIEQTSSRNGIRSDLLTLVGDKHASLIVMGCYGHPKIIEMLFRGVSHYALQALAAPVLIMH